MLLFIFQFSLLALILLSFFMVIAVPVVFASPSGWNDNKSYIIGGIIGWVGLVFILGGLNYFVI